MTRCIPLIALALPCLAHAGVNLVTNGSFEEPDINATLTDGQPYYFYERVAANTMEGWTHSDGLGVLDSRPGFWVASDGEQYIEIESGFGASISQLVNVVKGETYTLTFDYAGYLQGPNSDDSLAVYWGGELIDTVDLADSDISQLEWQSFSYQVTADSDSMELRFQDGAVGQSFHGGLLDNVSLVVPSPSAAGLALMVLISRSRRR